MNKEERALVESVRESIGLHTQSWDHSIPLARLVALIDKLDEKVLTYKAMGNELALMEFDDGCVIECEIEPRGSAAEYRFRWRDNVGVVRSKKGFKTLLRAYRSLRRDEL